MFKPNISLGLNQLRSMAGRFSEVQTVDFCCWLAGCLSQHFTIPNIVFVVYRKELSLIKNVCFASETQIFCFTSMDDSLSLLLPNTTSGAFSNCLHLLFIQGDLNHPRDPLDNEEPLSLYHSVKALAACNGWRNKNLTGHFRMHSQLSYFFFLSSCISFHP